MFWLLLNMGSTELNNNGTHKRGFLIASRPIIFTFKGAGWCMGTTLTKNTAVQYLHKYGYRFNILYSPICITHETKYSIIYCALQANLG